MNNKNNKTQRIGNIAKAALLAGGLAASSMADAIVITEINNYVDQGKIEFNIFDDSGVGLITVYLVDFYGGDLLTTDVTSSNGDYFTNATNAALLSDMNNDGSITGEIFYNLINTPLNISGNSVVSYVDNTSITSTYNVNNIYATAPIPAGVWLLGSGLLGVLGATRKKNKR